MRANPASPFSSYQKQVLVGLGGVLFTVVLDFMLFPALSSVLLEHLSLTTGQFGLIASAYPFAAGVSALLASGLADRFDRKRFLVFFYTGFLLGILLCGLSESYAMLFAGRVVAGVFGGVVASISYSIITDLFEVDQRGRAMGALQIAFALSLVAGLPLALVLSSQLDWRKAYFFILVLGLGFSGWLIHRLRPIAEHLSQGAKGAYWPHLQQTLSNPRHWLVYSNNTTIVFSDVLFMTFFSAYCTHNLGFSDEVLPILYGVGGIMALVSGPLSGALADRLGPVPVFWLGSLLVVITVSLYLLMSTATLWLLLIVHALLMVGITARMVTSTALATVVPAADKRGAFMSLDASIQQLAAGLAAILAGGVVIQASNGRLENFGVLCFIVISFVLISCGLMHRIHLLNQSRRGF
jgi:predicted MFS family arabinose efflux permease